MPSSDSGAMRPASSRGILADAAPVRSLLDALVTFVLAPACVACDQPLETPTCSPVCQHCWHAMAWLTAPLCPRCGSGLPMGALCRCPDRPAHIDSLASAALYSGATAPVLHAFKYSGHQSLGPLLAAQLRDHPHLDLHAVTWVVPVPLHPWRRWQRGFNQAERVARALGPPVLHALRRHRWTRPQAGLAAAARRANVRDAIGLRLSLWPGGHTRLLQALAGSHILLVDDVVTTGGTLSACARILKEAGARTVRAATVARTPAPGHGRGRVPKCPNGKIAE